MTQLLWIAFIFQYLWDTTQLKTSVSRTCSSCELLSFFSIFGIQHNSSIEYIRTISVVNCFHFSVSLGYNTTSLKTFAPPYRLWIAFIFQYLWDTTQPNKYSGLLTTSCELLSFFSIFGIQHNNPKIKSSFLCVVNCFHFSVSLGYNTTVSKVMYAKSWLWIAFIFQYLWDTTQPGLTASELPEGCELLSFFSIFGIQHNSNYFLKFFCCVVNCFHFSVSLGYNTTSCEKEQSNIQLWIAFIFQYLWDTTQLTLKLDQWAFCCELLSFFSIFGIQHNFSVSLYILPKLWIAFIFQYLWDTTQQREVLQWR